MKGVVTERKVSTRSCEGALRRGGRNDVLSDQTSQGGHGTRKTHSLGRGRLQFRALDARRRSGGALGGMKIRWAKR